MTGSLDRDRLGRLLDALNDRLRRANVRASLYLVGGAAMLLAYGRTRATSDVDVRIDAANEAVTAAVADVAAEHGLEYDWLNQHAAACIPREADLMDELERLTENPLVRMKILFSLYRRVRDLARIQASGTDSVLTLGDISQEE